MADSLAVIARCNSLLEAQLVRARLAAAGIDAHLPEERGAAVLGEHFAGVGGIRVLVPRAAAAQALELLGAQDETPGAADEDPDASPAGPHKHALLRGPHADASPAGPHENALGKKPRADALRTGSRESALGQCPICRSPRPLPPASALARGLLRALSALLPGAGAARLTCRVCGHRA